MHYSSPLFKLPILRNFSAITLGRFVFFKEPQETVSHELIVHEQVHLKQIAEIGIIRFYISYLLYFFAGIVRFSSWNQAYNQIPFEVEAYEVGHE